MKRILKNILKRTLPDFVVEMVSIRRSFRASEKNNKYLNEIGQEIRPELINNLTLLSSRLDLLDVLPKDGCVAEVGVASGLYSKEIWHRAKPRSLHLIDKWSSNLVTEGEHAKRLVENAFSGQIANSVVHIHQGISWDTLSQFPDSYFDWVYIDAAHDYESVKKDLNICINKVINGGYICGHDYITWSSGLVRFGVVEAVNEMTNQTNSQLVYLTNQKNRHLSYAVKLNKE